MIARRHARIYVCRRFVRINNLDMDEEKDTRKVEEKPIGNGTPEESRKRKRRRENLPTLVPKFGMAAFDTEVGGCDNWGGG